MFLICPFAVTCVSQSGADRWLRVLTDEDSITEVDRFSLVLEPDQMIRAEFRTTFTKPVPLSGKSQARYQSRLDSIQFRLEWRHGYRVRESRFIDNSGQVVSSSSPANADKWKPVAGRTATALFSAAIQLRPFGIWKIISYRYSSGEGPSKNEPPELKGLVGSDMYLVLNSVRVGNIACDSAILEPTVMTDQEFSRRVGSSLESVGMADKANAFYLRCMEREKSFGHSAPVQLGKSGLFIGGPSNRPLSPSKFPAATLMLRRSHDRILMLWDGVFLELERTKNIFLPRSY